MPTYTVHTVCTATVRETWRVTSPVPLDDDAMIDVMCGTTETPAGVTLNCTHEDVSDEEDRTVTAIEDDDGTDWIVTTPDVDPDPDVNWRNDAIQFPRLLAEIAAVVQLTDAQWAALSATTDLTGTQLVDIFTRAIETWDDIKRRTPAAKETR